MKNIKIKIEDIDFSKPVNYYCKIYGLSENAIRNRFKRLGIYNKFVYVNKNNAIVDSEKRQEEYNKNTNKCLECNNVLSYKKRENKFCSRSCSATYWNRESPKILTDKQKEHLSKIAKERNFAKTFEPYLEKHRRVPIIKVCEHCKKEFSYKKQGKKPRKFCGKECSNKGTVHTKSGGYRKNSGRGKSGWYKGYHCQSSWELAWIIYSLEHNFKFERNTKGFEYFFEDKIHKYFPDFYIPDGDYFIEIKGYPNKQNDAKIEQFKHKIIVLYKQDMKEIISYVISKYGNNFIELYEGNPYKIKNKKCLYCNKSVVNKYCNQSCQGKHIGKLNLIHQNSVI